MDPFTRPSLWAAAAVPAIYFGAQAAAAPFFPNFSFASHTASMLGSNLSTHPHILNGGAVLSGLLSLAAAWGLFRGLRSRGVWLVLAVLVAACSVSFGLASLWAASHPLPDPAHNPGALGAGMFAAPFAVFLASLRLAGATSLRIYLTVNIAAFFLVASLYSGLVPVDLQLYAGAVQRFGAFVMLLPSAVLGVWLLRSGVAIARPPMNPDVRSSRR